MHFESPLAFLLLLLIPLLIWFKHFRIKGGAIRFSTVGNAAKAGKSFRQRWLWLPAFMRIMALILLIVALARPQTGREQIREISKGVAIEMVVDRSSSMGAELEYEGEQMNRLEVVKRVFKEFVIGGNKNLPGRPNDLIGMINFARYPDTVCPLTLAHGALPAFLKNVKLAQTRAEDGTAIGDALALAAARLKTAEESLKKQQNKADTYEIKSKVIVLLSDGENNCGKRTPDEAAALASKWDIKVYTIAIGGGEAVTSIKTPFGVYKLPSRQRVDTKTLEALAEKTGGFFRKAEDGESLREIYEEIDKMEKTEIESVRFIDYKESFLVFVLAGLILIGFEILLNNTLFRKIP
jgi:Ca-activated chloride channel family protein